MNYFASKIFINKLLHVFRSKLVFFFQADYIKMDYPNNMQNFVSSHVERIKGLVLIKGRNSKHK